MPEMTIEELRERMQAEGIRPEDNEGSREIIRMRYGAEELDGIDPIALCEDKQALSRLVDEFNRKHHLEPVPGMTIEKLRKMAKSEKIRPEENAGSRDLIRLRYGPDAE